MTFNVFKRIALVFIVSRLLIFLTGYLAINLFSSYTVPPEYENTPQSGWVSTNMKLPVLLTETRVPGLGDVSKFDTDYYFEIAQGGYTKTKISEEHGPANWVFFPLYPMAIYAVKELLSIDMKAASLLLANLFLFIALYYIYHISLMKGLTEKQADKVILFILIFPSAIFYSVPYTESLFLLLSSATIYYSLKGEYNKSILISGLSMITRWPGVINFLFCAGIYLAKNNLKDIWTDKKFLVSMIISLIPIALFFTYMYYLTGDFLAPLHEQTLNWDRRFMMPFTNYFNYLSHLYFVPFGGWDNGFISFLIATSVFFIIIFYTLKNKNDIFNNKESAIFYIYGISLIVIAFSSSVFFISTTRYVMVCIPFYLYLVSIARKYNFIETLYLLFYVIMNTIITMAYFNNYFFVV